MLTVVMVAGVFYDENGSAEWAIAIILMWALL